MPHLTNSVRYSLVPSKSSLLTTTLFFSVIATLVLNDTKYSVPFMTLQQSSTVYWSLVVFHSYFAVRKVDTTREDSGVVQMLDLIRFRTNKVRDSETLNPIILNWVIALCHYQSNHIIKTQHDITLYIFMFAHCSVIYIRVLYYMYRLN
jgi:purine-cytosine permease-like protein